MRQEAIAPWLGGFYALTIAAFSYALAEWVGESLLDFSRSPISPVLVATLLGALVGNTLAFDARVASGFRFCASTVLKTGIVFLGLRLSLAAVGEIGAQAIPVVTICIVVALAVVIFIGKRLGLSWKLSGLIAAGTSICGCTAIVAVAPLIRSNTAETSYAIGTITLFGLVAMFTYPYLANSLFDGNATAAGLFLGTAIHETAQVAGSGFIYKQLFDSPAALDVATVTKLVRNLSMVIIIPLIGVYMSRQAHGTSQTQPPWYRTIPLFIVGFAVMSLLRTVGDSGSEAFGLLSPEHWQAFVAHATKFAKFCLVVAMAGIGLTTNVSQLTELGLKPFALGLFAATLVGVVSIGVIFLMQVA